MSCKRPNRFTAKDVKRISRICISTIILIVAFILEHTTDIGNLAFIIICGVSYIVIGYDVLWKALRGILHGQLFDENFLMAIASVCAFVIGDYAEAALVILLYQVGELFQDMAVRRSRSSIAELMDIRPDYANVMRNGECIQISPEEASVGETILIRPGERVPLDGVITDGISELNTAALTGESMPRTVQVGDKVASGCINMSGTLSVTVERPFEQSTVSKILELVDNASSNKASAENFITKFARYYTPCVVIGAVLLAVLPTLFGADFTEWLKRALTFLVVSCPCALVISVPLSFYAGLGAASKRGILIKGGNYIEALSQVNVIAMDKTGTVTCGKFSVSDVVLSDSVDLTKYGISHMSRELLLDLAAHAEAHSSHPIARALCASINSVDISRVSDVHEQAGFGVEALVDNIRVFVGKPQQNSACMNSSTLPKFDEIEQSSGCAVVAVVANDVYLGYVCLSDTPKIEAAQAIKELHALGVSRICMLTGDNKYVAERIASSVGFDEYHAGLLPADKVSLTAVLKEDARKLGGISRNGKNNGKLAFVGDGINDAPVIAGSDIGIAMGAIGSDAAIEAADAVIMNDDLTALPEAIRISRRTLRIARQNIVFAISIKLIVLVLGIFGLAPIALAIFADVGVSIIAVLNALRMMLYKAKEV